MAHIEHEGQVRTASGLMVIAGAWLTVSSFIFQFNAGWQWNQFAFGLIMLILGAVNMADSRYSWPSWVNMLISVWLFITAFAVGGGGALANQIIVSIITFALSIWDAEAIASSPSAHHA